MAAASPLLRAFMGAGSSSSPSALLYFGAPVLVPVVEALLVCFVLNALAGGAAAAAGHRAAGAAARWRWPGRR